MVNIPNAPTSALEALIACRKKRCDRTLIIPKIQRFYSRTRYVGIIFTFSIPMLSSCIRRAVDEKLHLEPILLLEHAFI